jgi:hypothetical protein
MSINNSKNNNNAQAEILDDDVEISDVYDEEITNEDYGFIVGADGELKSVFMPTDYFEIPEKVKAVFETFGISDPESVNVYTLH